MVRYAGTLLCTVLVACGPAARPQPMTPVTLEAAEEHPLAAPVPPPPLASSPSELRIYVVDVGQGDATLIEGPEVDGRRVRLLMDAGDNRATNGADIVGALLEDLDVEALDYVVVSHFDADHLGGFVETGFGTGRGRSLLWDSARNSNGSYECEALGLFPSVALFDVGEHASASPQSASEREWRACVQQLAPMHSVEHAEVRDGAHIGRSLDLGGGWAATIVAGGGYVLDHPQEIPDVDSKNERSIALLISNDAGFDFLVTGDLIGQEAGNEDEDALLEPALAQSLAARGIDVEVLRTGHHGAANATSPPFIRTIRPEVALISTGDRQGDSYQHPRCATYTTLASVEAEVIQTEAGRPDCSQLPLTPHVVNGDIAVIASGDRYEVRSLEGQQRSRVTQAQTQPLHRYCTLAGCADAWPEGQGEPEPTCCRVCTNSQACGDSCISTSHTCRRPPGCACPAPN